MRKNWKPSLSVFTFINTILLVVFILIRLFNRKKYYTHETVIIIIYKRRLNRKKTDGPYTNHHIRFKPSTRHHNCNVVITQNRNIKMEILSIFCYLNTFSSGNKNMNISHKRYFKTYWYLRLCAYFCIWIQF